MLAGLKQLTDESYRATLVESFDRSRDFDILRKISNAWLDRIRKQKKRSTVGDDEAAKLQGTVTSSSSSSAQCSSSSKAAWMVNCKTYS